MEENRIPAKVWDANLEGIRFLLQQTPNSNDTWTKRALRQREDHLRRISSWEGYSNHDTYQRLVRDLNRIIAKGVHESYGWRCSLANLEHRSLSTSRSSDLLSCAENPEQNPFFSFFASRLESLFSQEIPAIIGFSLNFLSQAFTTFSIIGFVKKNFPKIKIVVGGGLITSWTSRPEWKNPFQGLIDFLVAGPGEEALVKIVREENNRSPQGNFAPFCDTDIASLPYFSPIRVLPVSGSSGCFWRKCKFCPEASESTGFKPFSYNSVLKEIESMRSGADNGLIHFLDNAMSPQFLSCLAKQPPGFPWYGFARFCEPLSDEGFCRELKKSGCVMLQLGLESGSQKILDNMEKNINLGEASRILHNLRKAGIAAYVYLLFGTHFESEFDARRTMDYIVKHETCIDFLNLAIFNLPTSSPEFTMLSTQPFFTGDLTLYSDFIHPDGWDRKKVRAFLDLEFRTHSAIQPILRRDPPIFTSNHAPFFGSGLY